MEQDVLLLLRLEHRNQARLLTLLEAQADIAKGEGALELEMLQGIADYFLGYPNLCHHPKENALFRKLEKRAPETAANVASLLAEHEELSACALRLASSLKSATAESLAGDSEFIDAADSYARMLRHHMKLEEESFFPAVQEALTLSDWTEIDFQVFDQEDPLFSTTVEHRFEKLRNRVLQVDEECGKPLK